MSKIKKYIVATIRSIVLTVPLLLILSSTGFAVGLGNLSINSKLGEALNLEIDLLSVTPVELGTMTVGLASRSDFARAEVIYPDIAKLLKFEISEDSNGEYFFTIRSDNPINDTFLHLLISADWSGGKVIREYTALLDPPLYAGESVTPVQVPSVSDSESSGSISDATTQVIQSTQSGSISSLPSGAGLPSTISVQWGDTLSGIVSAIERPDSVSLYQALTAILQQNPDAFIDGNMNRLRAGAVLHVPDISQMTAVSRQSAIQNFQEQVAEYDQYLSDLGLPPVSSPEEGAEIETQIGSSSQNESAQAASDVTASSTEEVSATDTEVDLSEVNVNSNAEQKSITEDAGARLSIGQDATAAELASAVAGNQGDETQFNVLKNQLAQLDESLLASGVEGKEVKQRLQEIQAQVDRISKLIEVEDAGLAIAQNRAAAEDEDSQVNTQGTGAFPALDGSSSVDEGGETELVSTESTNEAATSENSATTPTPSTTNTDENTGSTSQAEDTTQQSSAENAQQLQPSAEQNQVTGTSSIQNEVQTAVDSSVNQVVDTTPERKVVKTSVMDTLTGLFGSVSDYALKIVAGLIALIALLFFYRRRKSQHEFEESMLDIGSGQISGNLTQKSFEQLDAASGIELASGGDSGLELTIGSGMSYLSGESIAGIAEEENEMAQGAVDPMAEADVYLAYDRDEQAIQVLKEAFSANPERTELAEKLLEIYHKQDDRIAFDKLAGELRDRIGVKNSIWTKVITMGKEVSPDNDLYTQPSELPDILVDDGLGINLESPADIKLVDEMPTLDIEKNDIDLNVKADDSVIKDLQIGDLELSLDDTKSAADHTLDAPTLSQIITVAEQGEREDSEVMPKDSREMEFNPGGDDDDGIELDDEGSSELSSAIAQLDSELLTENVELQALELDASSKDKAVEVKGITAIDEDLYLSEESEQSTSEMEPYHESETALELAKAYLELGEKDIAKGFIEEVINQGNDKQKAKAEKLVKELAG